MLRGRTNAGFGRIDQEGRYVLFILLAIWVGAWIWVARFHYLDDALIHLRYADMLRAHGFLTFDGVHPSHGTSSLLYVALLAAAGRILPSVFLPKVLSVTGYVVLLGLTLRRAWKAVRVAWDLWLLLLLILASPMAVRWFTDGMETSLATALALMVGYSAMPDPASSAGSGKSVAPMLLAFAWVLLRVETAFLLAFVCLGNAIYRFGTLAQGGRAATKAVPWPSRPCSSTGGTPVAQNLRSAKRSSGIVVQGARLGDSLRAMAREIQLAVGAALAVFAILVITGHIIPDTATAKAAGFYGVIAYARDVVVSFAASFSLGLGLLLFWVASMILAWTHAEKAKLWALGVVNLALPAELFIAMLRGQTMQGVRYFLPAVVMMVAWNLAFLEMSWRSKGSVLTRDDPQSLLSRFRLPIIGGLALLMLCEWALEGHVVRGIIAQRSAAFREMRSQHLEVLAGHAGVAYDIGFISYFTRASVCDMNGLVHGSQFASASADERAKRCAESSPVFAFVNNWQREDLSAWINFQDWTTCHTYELSNVFHRDTHYLLVRPDLAPVGCPGGDSANTLH